MLRQNDRVTLLRIDDMMAMCHRYEFTVTKSLEVMEGFERVGYEKRNVRVATVKQRGKRKEAYLDIKPGDILLHGWDLPFKTDTECVRDGSGSIMSGNACYNLIGIPSIIKGLIENQAAYPVENSAKACILVSSAPKTRCDDTEAELLYPEIESHHAVIDRIKAKSAQV